MLLIFLVNVSGLLLWKIKKELVLLILFKKILKESDGGKPNKIWVDKGGEFYKSSFTKCLKGNDIE